MHPARPLREVFDQLTDGSATEPLEGWPEPLLSEAIVSYADTAPVEVAEQLAPFVMAHTGGEAMPVEQGLELLAAAPTAGPEAPVDTDYGAGGQDVATVDEQEALEAAVDEVPLDLAWEVADLPEPGDLPPELELATEDVVDDGFDEGFQEG
jgi:hypothetical protein